MKIFIDLDEVLAGWVPALVDLLELDLQYVLRVWNKKTPRPWDVFDVLDIPSSRAWGRIALAGDSFWANLPLLPHAKQLVSKCQALGETTILTSPSSHPSSYAGKVKWLDHHFGRGFARQHALIGSKKRVVARPGAVLIDDSPAHCAEWTAEGGHAILFPGVSNALHEYRHVALEYIRPQLQGLQPCSSH